MLRGVIGSAQSLSSVEQIWKKRQDLPCVSHTGNLRQASQQWLLRGREREFKDILIFSPISGAFFSIFFCMAQFTEKNCTEMVSVYFPVQFVASGAASYCPSCMTGGGYTSTPHVIQLGPMSDVGLFPLRPRWSTRGIPVISAARMRMRGTPVERVGVRVRDLGQDQDF